MKRGCENGKGHQQSPRQENWTEAIVRRIMQAKQELKL